MKNFKEVPIPPRMRNLPLDKRGYPIPYTVLVEGGDVFFTINREDLRMKCLREDRCPICGTKLFRGRWFVGGPGSGLLPNGSYRDPPMHDECAHYALKVCPWLVVTEYDKRISHLFEPQTVATVDPTVIPDKPPLFVALMAVSQDIISVMTPEGAQIHIRPKGTFRKREYWRGGEQLSQAEGEAVSETYLKWVIEEAARRYGKNRQVDAGAERAGDAPQQSVSGR